MFTTQMLMILLIACLVGFLYTSSERKWETSLIFLGGMFIIGATLAFRFL